MWRGEQRGPLNRKSAAYRNGYGKPRKLTLSGGTIGWATAVIGKMLLVAEIRFRRLNAPQLLRDVYTEPSTRTV